MVDIKMPQLGDSVTECLVTAWLKKPGESVTDQEPLLEVTTDKVTVEIPAEVNGVVIEILAQVGQKVAIDSVICRIEPASK